MAEELTVEVVWKGEMQFEGRGNAGPAVPLDVAPPLGDDAGTKPMELVLVALAGCAGQTIVSLLQKMRQNIRTFSIRARGVKRPDHPRVFTEIRLDIEAAGPGLDRSAVEKAVQMTEEKYCPVFAMLKKSVDVRTTVAVSDDNG